MRARHHAAALSFALGAATCEEDGVEPPDGQGELVDLYLADGIEACAGQLPAYDRFLERAFDLWAGGVPPDFRARISAERETGCGSGFGCAAENQAWLAGQSAQYHELAHLVHLSTDGRSAPGLDEGMADAFGPPEPYFVAPEILIGLEPEVLFLPEPTAYDYVPLALFTRFLVDRHGIDAFRAYFRALGEPENPEPADFEREFQATFGESLQDAWSVFVSEPRCGYDLWFCDDATPVELPFVLDGIDCDSPSTLGFDAAGYAPPNVPYAPMTIVHVAVDEPSTLQLDLDNVNVDVGRCGECSPVELSSSYPEPAGPPPIVPITEVELEPGLYAFIVRHFGDGPARFSLSKKSS